MTAKDRQQRRRRPRQARSRATWEAILEAASQILERRGPAALNTNAIAERAGVSIGTLYQYFADKRAILVAAAQRELAAGPAGNGRRQRALIEALIAMLETLGRVGAVASRDSAAHPSQSSPKPRGERLMPVSLLRFAVIRSEQPG